MKTFEPILNTQPIQYAYDRPQFYRNKARENKFGSPVYFAPSTNTIDEVGCGGYGYKYGYPFNIEQGMYGNCTYWVLSRYYEVSNIILKECIGDAFLVYGKYKGRKSGGNYNGTYLGDKIQKGDMLVFADNTSGGVGHIVFVEDVDNVIHISESGYSKNKVYRGNACITYTLNKSDLYTGRKISLRPQSPYQEILYGVIHTGDVFDDYILPKAVERDTTKDQLYVGDIILNIRDEATTTSKLMGRLEKPNGYFNVNSVVKKDDYTWYSLGVDSWVAGVNEVTFYPKAKEKDYKTLYYEAQDKLNRIKEIVK